MNKVSLVSPEQVDGYEQFRLLNDGIIEAYHSGQRSKVAILSNMITIVELQLWRYSYADPKQPVTEEQGIVAWLGDLQKEGVPYTDTSTFYSKVRAIKFAEACKVPREQAIRLVVSQDSALRELMRPDISEVEVEGRGLSAILTVQPTDKIKAFQEDPAGYLERLSEVDSSDEGRHLVTGDAGRSSVSVVKAIKAHSLPKDVEFDTTVVLLDVLVVQGDRDWRYPVYLCFGKKVPKAVRTELTKKLKRSFEW